MAKINLRESKFVVLIAALFSGVLAFAILRGLLLNPGIIESIDIQWNQYVNMFALWFHTWNFYSNGSQIIFVSQFPIYSWVLVFQNVALAQRFVYFSIVSLVSFNMFLVTFYTLKKTVQKTTPAYLGSIVASLIYTLNPLIFSEIFHISFLWAYSLFPLVYYFGWEAFNNSSRRKVLVGALLLSMLFAFMADAWGMLVGLLILIIVAISSAVLNGRKNFVHKFVPNCLLTLLIMGIITVLLAAYWFLPYITQRASEPVWDPFSVANLVRNSQDSSLSNIFGLHSWSSVPFFTPPSSWEALTLILPIVAVLAVLLRRNKLTLTLSGLLLLGFFLSKGVQPPFGEFYSWLTFFSPRIIPVQSFLLKYPYLFLAIACLGVALLSSMLVSEVFGRAKISGFSPKRFSARSHGLPIVLFLSIISLIALIGSPLLTGNLNGALNPVTLPVQYKELNNFFSSQNSTFRVMWIPQEASFTWSNNPWANKIEYWGSAVPPLLYGWGIISSPNNGFLGNMIYDYLLKNQTQYLGKLLALGNVRYIVFHNDSENGNAASASQAFDLYFKEYKDYFNSFLSSDEYNYYFLSVNKTTGGIDDNGYLNFILKQEYIGNYQNSSEYQILNSPEVKVEIDSLSQLTSTNASALFGYFNQTALEKYDKQYNSSSFYKNLPTSRAYLNNFLHSQAFQDYLNKYQSSAVHQNFVDSPIYNNTHDYLNSLEYLTLTGTQYSQNSAEYKDFIDSPEYRGFLTYYLFYSTEYQAFQKSPQYTEYQTYLNYNSMYSNISSNLQMQRDLKLVTIPYSYDNESLFVFENMETMNYFQSYSKANLVVGGLDTFGSLSSIRDFYFNDSAFLFVENKHMSESDLASILKTQDLDKNLLFYDSKTFDDLVIDTIDTDDYIAPGEFFVNTSATGWLKDAVTSFSWTPITLGDYMGEKYDFGLGHNLLYTTNVGAAFDLPIEIGRSDEYSIWLRLLFSPNGGNMTFSIDNSNDTINTASSVLNGFKWVNLNNVNLASGSHTLRITSESGLNAINLVALPNVTDLEEHLQNVTNLIDQSNTKILYVMDKTFLSSTENNDTVTILVPYRSSFIINFQTNQSMTGSPLNLTVDNKVQSLSTNHSFSDTKNWYSTDPIDLSQGRHYIKFNTANIGKIIIYSTTQTSGSIESLNEILGNGAQPYVASYEKTGPASFSVKVNASKPFILTFHEAYDEFWQSNISAKKLILNSVDNGFLVNDSLGVPKNELVTISIDYTPEVTFRLGTMISAISLVSVIAAVGLALAFSKIKKRPLHSSKIISNKTVLNQMTIRSLTQKIMEEKSSNRNFS
jgi:hypothetical protein